jgi:hypothetical protein
MNERHVACMGEMRSASMLDGKYGEKRSLGRGDWTIILKWMLKK